jgi:hypothetical protein
MTVKLQIITALFGVLVLVFILRLVRRRLLQEKYAFLWIAVGLLTLPIAVFPQIIDKTATAIGIASGVSLVLFLAVVFLLLVCIHLSWETSRLEEEVRNLAEHVALMQPMKPTDE